VRRKKRSRFGAVILLLILLAAVLITVDSNKRIVTDEVSLYFDRLPVSFDGYRIAQLSDIHAAIFGDGNTKLIGAVEEARPDIIVITGDLIKFDDSEDLDLGIVRPLVRSFVEIAPVYYVTGNHEWDIDWLRELLKMLSDEGVTVLRNSYARLSVGDDVIVLAGLDDPNGPKDMKKPETLIQEIRKKEGDSFIVLLEHRNSMLDRFAALGVNLVFCGHAHGGIIRLPLIGGLVGPSRELFPQYTSGVYAKAGTKMFVSRGLGSSTNVPRFLNNPEIPVVSLKKA
jgi:predicted MPP superfamily phosphohydrolase